MIFPSSADTSPPSSERRSAPFLLVLKQKQQQPGTPRVSPNPLFCLSLPAALSRLLEVQIISINRGGADQVVGQELSPRSLGAHGAVPAQSCLSLLLSPVLVDFP